MKLTAVKESWGFQQCDTPAQTLWQLLLPCKRLARARGKPGWAWHGCKLWHLWSCRDKLQTLAVWQLQPPKISALPFVLLQRPFSCSVVGCLFSGGCNSTVLKMFERITGPSDSSGLGEPLEASTLLHPCLVQPWASECPWASLALLGVPEGRCHIDSHSWKLNNVSTEVVKNFIRSRAIPRFLSQLKATGCAHFSSVWQKD